MLGCMGFLLPKSHSQVTGKMTPESRMFCSFSSVSSTDHILIISTSLPCEIFPALRHFQSRYLVFPNRAEIFLRPPATLLVANIDGSLVLSEGWFKPLPLYPHSPHSPSSPRRNPEDSPGPHSGLPTAAAFTFKYGR